MASTTLLLALRGKGLRRVSSNQTAISEAHKAKKKAAGICITCTKPHAPTSGRYCQHHLDLKSKKVRDYRAAKRVLGICAKCSNPVAPGRSRYCADHLNRKWKSADVEEWKRPTAELIVQNVISGNFNMWCASRGDDRMWGETEEIARARFLKKFGEDAV